MNELRLLLRGPREVAPLLAYPPLGELLMDSEKINAGDLQHALILQQSIDAPLGDIMVSEGLVDRADVLSALAKQTRAARADLDLAPPSQAMAERLTVETCLRYGVLPWREDEQTLHIATPSPKQFLALRAALGATEKSLHPVIVDEAQIQKHLARLHGTDLASKALTRVPVAESCRTWDAARSRRLRWIAFVTLVCLVASVALPVVSITVASVLAATALCMTTLLKLAALVAHGTRGMPKSWLKGFQAKPFLSQLRRKKPYMTSTSGLAPLQAPMADAALRIAGAARAIGGDMLPSINADNQRFRLPRVSVLVPLLREREIAGQLITRLSRLTYPKSLLDVVLVLESHDTLTRETICRTKLPDWMRVIEVPGTGDLTTKPRALNYALDFCKGSIVGVWDAEDWPEADQIERVVTRFNKAPENVACLQGVLDYYNSRTNWLTRCFTIEYATWWRVFLPGIARLGMVVPLGGTTLFFRRNALEALGAWDAHNVTEDADLGVRLARHGYVTELLPTVTHEEATSRMWPWIRQRSRWLKGFLMTYFVHMRRPRALLQDLGPMRFFGVQTLFLFTVTQFALAPVLWSFWMVFAGFGHPSADVLGSGVLWAMIGLFVFSEAISLGAGLVGVSGRGHRHLIAFLPTMPVYFVLGTFAAYKALWELIRAPFFWDKTQHGMSLQTDQTP